MRGIGHGEGEPTEIANYSLGIFTPIQTCHLASSSVLDFKKIQNVKQINNFEAVAKKCFQVDDCRESYRC